MEKYMVSKWALVRRNELVAIPERIKIHKDFLTDLSEEEFAYSFRQIQELFYRMYTDIAECPERFGMPLYGVEVDYFSKEARETRTAPWKVFVLLLELFAWGELQNGVLVVDMTHFREKNQVKKTDTFEGEEKWHCGCCGAPFKLHPVQEDIECYLKLVELGKKR